MEDLIKALARAGAPVLGTEFVVDFGWRYRYLTLESDGHFSFVLQRIS